MTDIRKPAGDDVAVGMKRRTILAGAAWSVPVVVVATSTPALAATNDLTLAFDRSSYSGTACGTINGAYVTATRNGAVVTGESVTVTLADGYTFSDGSTSYTASTGSDGRISLPPIKVPATGGDSTFTASGGGASSSASVTAARTGQTYIAGDGTAGGDRGAPAGSTALNGNYWLSNGTLYYGSGPIASNVSSTSSGWYNGGNQISYTTSDGRTHLAGNGTARDDAGPNGSTPLNNNYWLKDGSLYYGQGLIATNVTATSTGWLDSNGTNSIAYTTSDGRTHLAGNGSVRNDAGPDGSTPLNNNYWLKDGSLYYGRGATGAVLTNVSATSTGWTNSSGANSVAVTQKDGTTYLVSNGSARKDSGPSSSTPLNGNYWLKDGALYYGTGPAKDSAGNAITNVSDASDGWVNGGNQIGFTQSKSC